MSHVDNERFLQLRQLLSKSPSAEIWEAITALLSRWTRSKGRATGIHYLQEHLESWPDDLRTPPARWFRRSRNKPYEPSSLFLDCCVLLRSLTLENNPVGSASLERLLSTSELQGLRQLHIADCSLSAGDLETLLSSELFPRLTHLTWREGMNTEELRPLVESEAPIALRFLDLCGTPDGAGNYLQEPELHRLAHNPAFAPLQCLRLSGFPIRNAPLETLLQSPVLTNLQWLEVGNARPSDPYESAQRRVLGLHRTPSNDCSGEALKVWLEGETLPALKGLSIVSPNFGDDGLSLLSSSPRLQQLTHLEFGVSLSVQGMTALFQSPYASGLRKLSFAGALGGDELLESLADSPALRALESIELREYRVSSEFSLKGVQRFLEARETLPQLRVLQLGLMRWLHQDKDNSPLKQIDSLQQLSQEHGIELQLTPTFTSPRTEFASFFQISPE
jgi:hypothetical protein